MADVERDWGQFVLLLIDVQRDFWGESVAERFAHFPTNVARLLDFCRTENLEVVHLRASYKPDMSDWMPRYKLRGRIPCVQGTDGIETLPFALEEPGETVVTKQTFDGFLAPELLAYLQQKGKRFVLTAGLVSSVCVLFTTVSAAQNGFLTAVVEDCCADDVQAHEQTLDRYRFIFDRTTVDCISDRYLEWLATLRELDR